MYAINQKLYSPTYGFGKIIDLVDSVVNIQLKKSKEEILFYETDMFELWFNEDEADEKFPELSFCNCFEAFKSVTKHSCPYQDDVGNGLKSYNKSKYHREKCYCNCCNYCEQQCCDDI